MEPAWAKDFPRLYELYLESKTAHLENYFREFDNVLKLPWAHEDYVRLEQELRQLDKPAWQALRQKALKCITIKNELRGHNQLFECLNEAKGYLYLKSEGCKEIHFISEEVIKRGVKTPDLHARCGRSKILLEVKTINTSDDERKWIQANSLIRDDSTRHMEARVGPRGLDNGLKNKIERAIKKAREQLFSYSAEKVKRRMVYLAINLDILFDCDSRNIDELVAYIQQQGNNQIVRIINEYYRRIDIILELTNEH